MKKRLSLVEIRALRFAVGLNGTEIAERANLGASAVYAALDRLRRYGYVRARRDPRDARALIYEISGAGGKALRRETATITGASE